MQILLVSMFVMALPCAASAQLKPAKKTVPKEDIMVMIDRRVDAYMMSKSTGSEEADKVLGDLTKMLEKCSSSTEEFMSFLGVLEKGYINRILRESKKVIDPKLLKKDPEGYVRVVMKPLHNRTTLTLLQIIMIDRTVPRVVEVFDGGSFDKTMRVIDLGRRKGGRGRSCGERYPLR